MIYMILSLMNLLLIMSSFIFSQLKHPLAMGFLLLIQTILIASITGLMINSFWFSYILFLVFLGGMLVLFIYVTALASNEMFNLSMKLTMMTLLLLFSSLIAIVMLINNVDILNNLFMINFETLNNLFMKINIENMESIYKLYNFPTNWMTCLMINYLLFTLIVVVKVTVFFYGPIRNLN